MSLPRERVKPGPREGNLPSVPLGAGHSDGRTPGWPRLEAQKLKNLFLEQHSVNSWNMNKHDKVNSLRAAHLWHRGREGETEIK